MASLIKLNRGQIARRAIDAERTTRTVLLPERIRGVIAIQLDRSIVFRILYSNSGSGDQHLIRHDLMPIDVVVGR